MAESSIDNFKKEQLKYLSKSYKVNFDILAKETVNILNDYAWVSDIALNSKNKIDLLPGESTNENYTISKKNNIPFCYVVERRSAANAGIANVFNLISHLEQVVEHSAAIAENTVDKIKELWNNSFSSNKKVDESTKKETEGEPQKKDGNTESWSGQIADLYKKVAEGMPDLIKENNLNNSFFLPYQYLYITKATGKSYVFPLANNYATFTNFKNTWGNGSALPGPLNSLISGAQDMLDGYMKGLNLIDNTKNFLSGNGDDVNYIREMAKSYSYPQDGDGVVTNFTLYNTTKIDAWKQNYKFLFLFVLRNLPLRISVASFVPPVLYDVLIPGVKHLPVCAVEAINIAPRGLMRTLSIDNFMGEGKLIVNVPEAWEVTISFRSLISRSANLTLSGINSALNITTSSSSDKQNNG